MTAAAVWLFHSPRRFWTLLLTATAVVVVLGAATFVPRTVALFTAAPSGSAATDTGGVAVPAVPDPLPAATAAARAWAAQDWAALDGVAVGGLSDELAKAPPAAAERITGPAAVTAVGDEVAVVVVPSTGGPVTLTLARAGGEWRVDSITGP